MTRRAILAVAFLWAPALAAPVTFSEPPRATRSGAGATVRFAVSAATDVEVAVIDAKGAVVRHLAAGVLGGKAAPPAPLQPGLRQELAWDGKADGGRDAGPGPFKVRVRLGLKAEFDKLIGWNGHHIDYPQALAVGPDGTLFVLHGKPFSGHRQTMLIAAYDRAGRYLRQVFPGPGGLDPAARAGWPHLKLADDADVPMVHHVLTRCLYPGVYFGDADVSNLAVTADNRLLAVSGCYSSGNALIKKADVRGGRRLMVFHADGTAPSDVLGPQIVGENVSGDARVAASPDGRVAYVTGFNAAGKQPGNTIYRVRLDGSGKVEPFAVKSNPAQAGKEGLNDTRGVAVDKDGNVYVSDAGNQRIAVFQPDGTFLGQIPADDASDLVVSAKRGTVYARLGDRLVKFGGLKDPTARAEAAFPDPGLKSATQKPRYCLALDDSGDEPVLYVSKKLWIKYGLQKLLDKGDKFESAGNPLAAHVSAENPGLSFVMELAVTGDKLITAMPCFPDGNASSTAFDVRTGKCLGPFRPISPAGKPESFNDLYFCGGEMTAGKDGRLYVQTGGFDWPEKEKYNPGTLRRYDADGQALPFEAVEQSFIKKFYHGHHRPAGKFITASGDIYVAAFPGYRGRDQKEPGMDVHLIGPDGRFKQEGLLHLVGVTVGGLAVDSRGNIYVGVQAQPKDHRLPDWAEGRLPANSNHGHPQHAYEQYGAIVKFPPAGGRIVPDEKGDYVGRPGGYAGRGPWAKEGVPVRMEGTVWYARAGYVPINSGYEAGCQCENTRFDVDAFDRLFVPDPYRFRVTVMDAAGNEAMHFGGYGNMDNRGPQSPRPAPAIAYGWPIAVQVVGEWVYVVDLTNRRIAVARLTCAAEEGRDIE